MIHPDAANEIRAAAFAYQDVAFDLSRAFVEDVKRAIDRAKLGEATSAYGLPEGMRTLTLERFAYRLYFYEQDGASRPKAERGRNQEAKLFLVAFRRIPRLLRANAVRFAS